MCRERLLAMMVARGGALSRPGSSEPESGLYGIGNPPMSRDQIR
jgi:hypothetical protein